MVATMVNMKYHYGLKLRIFPSSTQKRTIDNNINASRFAYNEMVAIDRELHMLKQVKIPVDTIQKQIKYLQERRNNTQMLFAIHPWLAGTGIGTDVIDQARRAYQNAWRQFNKTHRFGIPVFHRKRAEGSYQLPTRYTKSQCGLSLGSNRFISQNHIKISGLGKLRVSGSQKRLFRLADNIRIGTVTVKRDSTERYFISMQLGSNTPFVTPLTPTGLAIGIDLNTENFLTDSNGGIVANPRYYYTIRKKLAREQRKLARKKLRAEKEHRLICASKNYQKQRILVANIQRKVANRRNSFLHFESTTLIKNHDLIVAENLNERALLRNHTRAMSIADAGWRTFLGMLAYKAVFYERTFKTVNPKNTTQTCSDCGFIMTGVNRLTLADRSWGCPKCGSYHLRDYNAARNILARGISNS